MTQDRASRRRAREGGELEPQVLDTRHVGPDALIREISLENK